MLEPLAPEISMFHIGDVAPWILNEGGDPIDVSLRQGPVVETILHAADAADLIAMPTDGQHGFLDALRGSTTEQVLRRATSPLLALPA
jgi:nucleotide-binding universal stress UspA family protein